MESRGAKRERPRRREDCLLLRRFGPRGGGCRHGRRGLVGDVALELVVGEVLEGPKPVPGGEPGLGPHGKKINCI